MSVISTRQKGIYFPGLNGIRALAALSVVFSHIDDYKWRFGFASSPTLSKILLSGNDAVIMFFVLSGFLITYLLMTEIQKTGMVSVKKFYARRMLRIWPVYYLLLFLSLGTLPFLIQTFHYQGEFVPQTATPFQVILYIIMLPNAAAFFGTILPGISQLWTIGIEEQFYLIWPVLAKLFAKRIFVAIVGIFVVKIILNFVFIQIVANVSFPLVFRTLLAFLNNLPFENMAVGALGAYLLFHKHKLLNLIFHPVVEKLTLLFMLCNILFLNSSNSPSFAVLYCIPYILFILNVSSNPKSTLKLENRLFNWLGKLSYGIYMYHLFVAYIVFLVFTYVDAVHWNSIVFNVMVYSLVVGLTILVADISHRWYEQPFLNLKNRFTIVKSNSLQQTAVDTLSVSIAKTGS